MKCKDGMSRAGQIEEGYVSILQGWIWGSISTWQKTTGQSRVIISSIFGWVVGLVTYAYMELNINLSILTSYFLFGCFVIWM